MLSSIRIFLSSEGAKKYLANTSWLIVEKLLRIFVGLFVNIWMVRYLQPEQFGVLSYAISFAGLFTAAAALGLDEILIRNLVKDEMQRDSILGSAFLLRLMGGIVANIILFGVTYIVSDDRNTNLMVMIIGSTMIFQSFNVIDFYFQSKVKSRFVVYANIIALGLSSLIKILLIVYEAPVVAFAWAQALEAVFLAIGFVFFYVRHRLSFWQWRLDIALSINLLNSSWPLILSSLAISLYMKLDQVMIKQMIDPAAVGQYSAAVKLTEAWYFVPTVISSSLFPAILNAHKVSNEFFLARLQLLYDLMVWLSLSIAVMFTLFSEPITYFLFGPAFDETGSVISIHIWSGVFVFLGAASGKWFISQNLQRLSFYRALWGLLINIGLNFVFIPMYGIKGAAAATLISQVVATYLFDLFNPLTRGQFMMKTKSLLFLSLIRRIGKS